MTLLVIYSMSVSLDGFIAGPDGSIDWAAPGEELMAFHNEQTRELAGHLSGRGLYKDMLPWESRDDAGQIRGRASSPSSGRPSRRSSSPPR
jgi:dihydrofolate reductase